MSTPQDSVDGARADEPSRKPRRRRWLRVLLSLLLGVVVLVLAFFGAAHLLTSDFAWARAVAWQESDVEDQFRFPARIVRAGEKVSPLPKGPEPAVLAAPVNVDLVGRPLDSLLEGSGTRAFLVVRHDRLVYERYFDGAGREDRQTSFSAAKSFLSTLVGIAIEDGYIGHVTDPVTKYVPELSDRDPRFARITIRDLLTMSSGIEYTEAGLPWSDDALTYYGTDLRDLALTHTHVAEPPGRTWRYDNYNPLLLGLVLERATKVPVAVYMSKRLWQPLGPEADATWSLDSSQSGFEKMESGFNARPVDYARFGLMMLHEGRWNGRQIVSASWVKEATAASRTTDPADFYQYMWWVGAPTVGGRPPFFAVGRYGQIVGVFPDQDMVVVRLGTTSAGIDWQALLRDVVDRVAAVD
ncbi:MAG TPA: serine hydrolase [Nocardioidaceae bacterium]|nr:serine hydrolase [Nocardioidaceae bacterium]